MQSRQMKYKITITSNKYVHVHFALALDWNHYDHFVVVKKVCLYEQEYL